MPCPSLPPAAAAMVLNVPPPAPQSNTEANTLLSWQPTPAPTLSPAGAQGRCVFHQNALLGLPLHHNHHRGTWLPAAGAAPPAACFDTEVKAPLMASVLEQFNRVTQMARERTSTLLASAAYLSPGPGA